ncbi:MAG: Uncharacterized protein G01um101429_674 [Parcubacteria group bacterium Gr01-1014_29]|nr:MAG: Uncharacterized protein G01um101429_674 [Parcubacteria group bacterium Gr01-1014_29]
MQPGPKPKGKVRCVWSPEFAYAIGLITTDGCLSRDGRHVDLTSKDREQLITFLDCLGVTSNISLKTSGSSSRTYPRVQIGDVLFYNFLVSIGLTPAKSKTLGRVNIPDEYFFDFLRGAFDGDGTFYSYYDPRWKSSFMFYTSFVSASSQYLQWLRGELFNRLGINGHVSGDGRKKISVSQLRFAKEESLKVLRAMYYKNNIPYLRRKKLKIDKALRTIGVVLNRRAQVEKLVNSPA